MTERKRFAFNGVELSVPAEWDLTRFSGDARKGEIVLDDGNRPAMHAEWMPPKKKESPGALADRLLAKRKDLRIRRRQDVSHREEVLLAETDAGQRLTLAVVDQPERQRVVLATVYDFPGSDAQGFARTLTKPLLEPPGDTEPWRFFATAFDVPAGFLLERGELRAGCMKLVFETRRGRLSLWDFALLDHLETKDEGVETYVRRAVEQAYPKRFAFPAKETGPISHDPAGFDRDGRLRRRWWFEPKTIWNGRRRARLTGVPNRERNRFAALLWEYGREGDRGAVDVTIRSLAG